MAFSPEPTDEVALGPAPASEPEPSFGRLVCGNVRAVALVNAVVTTLVTALLFFFVEKVVAAVAVGLCAGFWLSM